ncbi:leucine zipper putative tumor suppressor 1 [Chanos chanos]|uniref:Leucine zipper putative tumor suppressor 1 n=1 Tax=Chanos chanos TaxID=29144 RepID=A0A6J2WG94_CHACN|nr:leucine zipper putative tumor suppressor 1 [Chanos chanos]
MGSVSSLISGHSLHSKHCRASQHKLKKGHHLKKTGLLRYGFSQDTSATNNNSKAIFQSGKNDDFFYIKVSNNKPHVSQHRNSTLEEPEGGTDDLNARRGTPPELVPLSGKLEKNAEKLLIRPTAFKPVLPRSTSSSMETHNNLNQIIGVSLNSKEPSDPKQEAGSATLSDSGRNSMSSLPTHSTSGSSQMDNLSTSTGHLVRHGGSAQNMGLAQQQHSSVNGAGGNSGSGWMTGTSGSNGINGTNWINGTCGSNGTASSSAKSVGLLGESVTSAMSLNRDTTTAVVPVSLTEPQISMFSKPQELFSEPGPTDPTTSGGCVRSPISMDESLIQQLERKLLERESELAELQTTFEEKESDTCQLFEEKQRYCAEEMEGLKQRCSTKLRQVSQRALRAQQLLQLQVIQLQQDKERLQEEVDQLTRDKEAAESKLRNCERQQTQLAPTLEETQWEVCQKSGEISLLKQQLKDSQADAGHKLSEIVSLKASLRDVRSKMEELEQKNKEQEEGLRARSTEAEVCQNELQRKKNEADLLREKVGTLEMDIKNMKQDLAVAKDEQLKLLNMRAKLEEERLQLQISRAKMEVHGSGKAKMADQEGSAENRNPNQSEQSVDTDALKREVERLRGELREEKQKKDKMMSSFQHERQTWNKEKDKVIRYQKQLQYNYLQMHRKNRDLEKILQELTVEMDKRTELDIDVHSSKFHYEDIVATEI